MCPSLPRDKCEGCSCNVEVDLRLIPPATITSMRFDIESIKKHYNMGPQAERSFYASVRTTATASALAVITPFVPALLPAFMYRWDNSSALFSLLDEEPRTSRVDGSRPKPTPSILVSSLRALTLSPLQPPRSVAVGITVGKKTRENKTVTDIFD